MRQLLWMVEGRRREIYAHTSIINTALWNFIRDPKRKPFTFKDFNPYHEEPEPMRVEMREMRALLGK